MMIPNWPATRLIIIHLKYTFFRFVSKIEGNAVEEGEKVFFEGIVDAQPQQSKKQILLKWNDTKFCILYSTQNTLIEKLCVAHTIEKDSAFCIFSALKTDNFSDENIFMQISKRIFII